MKFDLFLLPRLFLAMTLATAMAGMAWGDPPPAPGAKVTSLFNGRTLEGWEGDPKLWRAQDGAITGGSLTETVKQNEFLATQRAFTNFIVRMQIKLTGQEGFINSGFQIRSQRLPNSSEMAGYQCDYGDPNWWGAIYDESRRNKVLSPSDMKALGSVVRRNDWNEYIIRADGPRITTWLNGIQGTDYTEEDGNIPDFGKMGIQLHGGGKALVQVKAITIEELPVLPADKKFLGAPASGRSAGATPLTPEAEQATFTLPPGFEIELVASEEDGIGKFVTVDWDLQGRMWSMTALEYPVDANENAAAAQALYASRARDKVVVWDSPFGSGPHPARVFAEGLAIPLGILPYQNGVYVQHGPEIVFLSDTDGDGKADKREVILTGFGVQDSHLFPHQFTRAPGNWIWFAQGAFNYGKVKTSKGAEQQFDRTRMARFRYDGSEFDITSQGPCNIWGLVLTDEGEAFIQEANDYGYPLMPFHAQANYPGCSDALFKSYAPEFPGTAPHFRMGGTGLSGLALSDRRAWPEPYANVFYVANPITRKIQAIRVHRDGPRHRLEKLPDFVQSSDEMFRPVALKLGPDGCLYIVDWYNKIISHNEVPRNHPERDKKRGRIWRVKHREQKPFVVPDFTKISGDELLKKLGGDSLTQHHLAWQAITDRQLQELTPKLRGLVAEFSGAEGDGLLLGVRIGALWALEGLHALDAKTLLPLLREPGRNLRREAVRALGGSGIPPGEMLAALESMANDTDPEVRAEIIRVAGRGAGTEPRAVALLVKFALSSLEAPTAPSTQSGRPIKVGAAYEREFERYLVRLFLEPHPAAVAAFLESEQAKSLPIENRMLATLALAPKSSASRIAQLLTLLKRPTADEEILRLAQFVNEPGVRGALTALMERPEGRTVALESLLRNRSRIDAAPLTPLLTNAATRLWESDKAGRGLALRVAAAFKLVAMDKLIARDLAGNSRLEAPEKIAMMRALREMESSEIDAILPQLKSPIRGVADEAVLTLATSKHERAPELLLKKFWPDLSDAQRRSALMQLASTRRGAGGQVARR